MASDVCCAKAKMDTDPLPAKLAPLSFRLLRLNFAYCSDVSRNLCEIEEYFRRAAKKKPKTIAAVRRYGVMPDQAQPFRRVYMLFNLDNDWQVSFLEADLTISHLKPLTFADPEDIRDLARRGEALETSEARALFDYSIGSGRGGIYLQLTTTQYSTLQERGCERAKQVPQSRGARTMN